MRAVHVEDVAVEMGKPRNEALFPIHVFGSSWKLVGRPMQRSQILTSGTSR